MAVPSYTTDLQIFNDASDDTGWVEFTGMALGAPPATDIDLAIYGSSCITSDRAKVGLNSNGYDGTAVTLVTDGAFFIWHKFFAPNSLDTIANGGIRVAIGSSLSNYYAWYVGGSDTYAYGGWVNFAVDPRIGSPDMTTGSPDGTFGAVANGWKLLNAPSKGNPFNTDIIRYGRGESRFTGGETSDYATIAGYALVNDNATTGRFGLIQAIAGGYLFKGLMSLGLAATAVDMRDANVAITIDDTLTVTSGFNRIEVHNAASNVEWTSFSISKVGSLSKGQFEMIDNATVTKVGCTFTDMDSFIYQSNATLTGCTYRRCGIVTLGGGTFTNCLFTNASGITATIATSLSPLVTCTFESSGTGYAVDLSATTISTDTTMSWTNTSSGYTDTSGNRTLKVTVDGTATLTINNDTGDTLFYENAGTSTAGANGDGVVIVTGQRTITFNLTPTPTDYEYRIYTVTAAGSLAGASEVQGAESNSASSQAYTYSYSAGVTIAFQVLDHSNIYKESISYFELQDSNSSQTINLEEDTND